MVTQSSTQQLVEQKLAAFDLLQPEFETCFLFVEDMHGQRRFPFCSVSDIVRYFHALWVCDCKTYLLSIPRTIKTYDGPLCLDLLKGWQNTGDSILIVEFLYRKLDALPMIMITRQIEESLHDPAQRELTQSLLRGRNVLLNRGMNLLHLLDAMFQPSREELWRMLRDACSYYGHTPEQIAQQLELLSSPPYSYVPHQQLAQRNMIVMNKLGIHVTAHSTDIPGQRTTRVEPGTTPMPPYAEEVIPNYLEMVAPWHNNLKGDRFVDRPELDPHETV